VDVCVSNIEFDNKNLEIARRRHILTQKETIQTDTKRARPGPEHSDS